MPGPEENKPAMEKMSEKSKADASAMLANAIQTCASIKDEVDTAEIMDGAPPPEATIGKVLAVASSLMDSVKAMSGAPEEPAAPAPEDPATKGLAGPVADGVTPSEVQMSVAASVVKAALAKAKSIKANWPVEKAKPAPKMNYKQFISLQSDHFARFFELIMELIPLLSEVAETPAQEAAEQGAPDSQPAPAATPAPAPAPAPDPIAEEPAEMSKTAVEAITNAILKALEPKLASARGENVKLEKQIESLGADLAKLQKARPASQSVPVDSSSGPPLSSFTGTRDLAKEVREERAAKAKR